MYHSVMQRVLRMDIRVWLLHLLDQRCAEYKPIAYPTPVWYLAKGQQTRKTYIHQSTADTPSATADDLHVGYSFADTSTRRVQPLKLNANTTPRARAGDHPEQWPVSYRSNSQRDITGALAGEVSWDTLSVQLELKTMFEKRPRFCAGPDKPLRGRMDFRVRLCKAYEP